MTRSRVIAFFLWPDTTPSDSIVYKSGATEAHALDYFLGFLGRGVGSEAISQVHYTCSAGSFAADVFAEAAVTT